MALLSTPSLARQKSSHVVKPGETLGGLALKYRCSVRDLRKANGLRGDLIRIGQKLRLPGAEDEATKAPAEAGKPASEAKAKAKRAGGKPDVGPNAHLIEHQIVAGDTLGGIAERYGTSVDRLREDNGLDSDIIVVGRKLWVRATLPRRQQRRFVYTIQPGDTLGEIAGRFGMDWRKISRWNGGRDPRRLRIGDRLTLYLEGPGVRSETVGKPQHGRLVNGEQLPPGPGYKRRRPHRAWGTNETITQLLAAIAEVRQKFPKVHDLLIGDISKKGGGRLHPHISHQSGRDVDVGFYFENQPPEGPDYFLRLRRHPIDFEPSWALIKALVGNNEHDTRVQHIFLSYREQKLFYDWAKKKGVSDRELGWIFQYPRGRRAMAGKIRHVKGHVGHMHVRFKCPRRDDDCVM